MPTSPVPNRPSCHVVGAGIVPLRCLEILQARGFDVRGVWSGDGSLRSLGPLHAESRDAFVAALRASPYDYLFSLNNGWVIPDDVVATASRAAINYHDSPLPKYAGLHATSWALLHGEREHAITFHEIVAEIDGGRIYLQRRVAIEEDDTALDLNSRCFEAAVEAFDELAAQLAKGDVEPRPQPAATARSYFGLRDRPRAACTIDVGSEAAAIVNLCRALDFGPPRNPLGLPKLRTAAGYVAVRQARVLADRSPGPPGTVVAVEDDGLRITTGTNDATLRGVTTLEGVALSAASLAADHGVVVGVVLPSTTAAEAEAIGRFTSTVCVHEAAWARQLVSLAPLSHPYATTAATTAPWTRTVLPLAGDVAAVFALYAARLSPEPVLDVGLSTIAQHGGPAALYAPIAPLRLTRAAESTLADVVAGWSAERKRLDRLGTFARDLYPRFPELRAVGPTRLPLAIVVVASPDTPLDELDADMLLVAYEDGSPPALLDRATLLPWQRTAVARQLAQVERTLRATPQIPMSSLSLLDDEERHQVLVEWNQTRAPFPSCSVPALVSTQAARTPAAKAVRFGDASISYDTLERRSNQLARRLGALGVGRGDLVALCLERSIEVVVGLLGILKAGAAYVPIDPSYPAGRVEHMLTDSGARVAVTQHSLRERFFAGETVKAVSLDDDAAALAVLDDAPVGVAVDPADICYVIYTSGSTGTPKGVEVTHRGLVNHSSFIAARYGLGAGDRMLCSASISFDVAGEQIYPALFAGAEVVVRPDDLFESFARFERFVRDEAITAMVLPTAFWHEWVRELSRSGAGIPPALRALSTGTEKVAAEVLAAWESLSAGRVQFFQGYGPTETTVTCTMYVHDGAAVDIGRAVPIGRPLPNTEIYVLDERLEPVPVGMPGEIFVGGVGLARGYHARPQLTAERFVADPRNPGARLYRTGDLGRFEPDGQVVYLGRTDFQVKLRGFRVELGEIESVLRQFPGVADAVVVLREDGGAKRLVAYVIGGEADDLAGLKPFAAERLPEYMVPAAVVKLRSYPMTPNQKVDRKALPAPPPPERPAAAAASDAVERQLVQIWERVLALAPVGVDDNFFELGGDSLRAIQLLNAVEREAGVRCSLPMLFRMPTIRGFAAEMRSRAKDPSAPVDEPVVRPLNQGGSGPTLFCIWGHNLYQPLADALAGESPVAVVYVPFEQELFSLDKMKARSAPLSVEAMATQYLKAVKAHQPRGPYCLTGSSMGGVLAYEIAQQLLDEGEEVAVLAMLDSRLRLTLRRHWGKWAVEHVMRAKAAGPGYLMQKATRRLRRARWGQNFPGALGLNEPPPAPPTEADLEIKRLEAVRAEIFNEAIRRYQPRPRRGHAMLIRARDTDCLTSDIADLTYGWGALVSELETAVVPGNHLGILRAPNVSLLAEALRPRLLLAR
ncbi:MAG: amino acid adenylation domain-containing protein [Planctomycetota bacterium]|nr:amino acid adenylation domain-containing protein [Planctomycetota bacterium]